MPDVSFTNAQRRWVTTGGILIASGKRRHRHIEFHSGANALLALMGEIGAVYREAFGQSPYFRVEADVAEFAESMAAHSARAGFRLVLARDDRDGTVVGFTYGYTLAPGHWWYEQVAPLLPPEGMSAILDDAFLLTQIAVTPRAQGQGLGSRLHDALLDGIPQPRALLSTRQDDSPARHLYARRGWLPLLSDVSFPGANHPYLVMIRELPTPTE